MGVDKAASRGVYDVLINGADVTASVAHTRYGDVLLLESHGGRGY